MLRYPRTLLIFIAFVWIAVGGNHLYRHFTDYPVYELAANKILDGRVNEIYDRTRLTPGGYYYPFVFALSFIPFAAAGVLGKWFTLALFLLCYAHLLHFSLQQFGNAETGRQKGLLLLAISLLSANSFNDALMNANIGLLLLSLCLVAFQMQERAPHWAGAALGLAISIKLYPVIVLCYFIWARRWRLVVATVVSSLLLLYGLPLLTQGWNGGWQLIQDQAYVLSHFGQHWPYDSAVFQNVSATAMRLGRPTSLAPQTLFRLSLAFSGLVVILFYSRSFIQGLYAPFRDANLEKALFALSLALVPLLVPVSWYNMGLFYVPLLVAMMNRARGGDRLALAALTGYCLFYCLLTPDLVGREISRSANHHALPFFSVLAVVLLFAYRLTQQHPNRFRRIN